MRDALESMLMSFGVSRSKAIVEIDSTLGAIAALGTLFFAMVVTITDLPHYWAKTLVSLAIAVFCTLLAKNKLAVAAGCLIFLAIRFAWALLLTR